MLNASRYEAYKNSGSEWLGDIPASWPMALLSQIVTQVKNKNSDLAEKNLLSLSYGRIKRKPIDTSGGLLPASFDGYNIIEANDIVLRLTDLQNDHTSLRVGLSPERGIITSAYTTMRPKNIKGAKYLYYLLHTFDIRKGFYGMGSGVRQGLNYDEVKRLKLPLPTEEEQITIAAFLDKKIAHIDSVINDAKSSIEEYMAWKASIIYEAVTKGFDPNVEMKDSGVEWIAQVPTMVHVSRVGLHYEIILGKMLCPEPINHRYSLEPYFCAANVHFSGVDAADLKKMWFSPEEKEKYAVKRGDLLVVEGGAGAGGCSIYSLDGDGIYVQNSIMIVRSKGSADNRYLKFLLESLVSRGYVDCVCNKATIPHFTKEKLSAVPFPVFSLAEQVRIAEYLDQKCIQIENLIAEKETLITDLESYKKALIFEVVTGKRKVV